MIHYISIFAIFIPTITGFIRYRFVDSSYRYFIWCLLIGCINELFQNIFYSENLLRAYFQIAYTLGEFILLSKVLQLWTGKRKPFLLFWFLISCAVGFDTYILPKLEFTLKITNSLEPTLLVILAIPVMAKEFSKQKIQMQNARLLILLPIVITSVFDIIFNLSLWIAYSKATQQFFINCMYLLNLLQFLGYICFTFALIWAPKKEEFLLL